MLLSNLGFRHIMETQSLTKFWRTNKHSSKGCRWKRCCSLQAWNCQRGHFWCFPIPQRNLFRDLFLNFYRSQTWAFSARVGPGNDGRRQQGGSARIQACLRWEILLLLLHLRWDLLLHLRIKEDREDLNLPHRAKKPSEIWESFWHKLFYKRTFLQVLKVINFAGLAQ